MVDKISLPVIIPEKLLISPGVWNGNEYTAMELGGAFARTDWTNKEKISLWLNHDDTNTGAFVGYVKNPKLASRGRVFGDLEIWDEKTAILLTQAMAKFGVSAKIMGLENKKGKMQDFTFENFSIVTIPACAEAYINLSKKEEGESDGVITSKYLLSKDEIEAIKKDSKSSSDKIERRLKKMERLQEEKKEEIVEDKKEEEVTKEPEEKELSSKIDGLAEKFDKLIAMLSKKFDKKELEEEPKEEEKKEETPAEEKTIDPEGEVLLPKEEEKTEEVEKEVENKELTAVKKELADIKAKLSAPKSKTVKNLSSNNVGMNEKYDANIFCDFIHTVNRPVRII